MRGIPHSPSSEPGASEHRSRRRGAQASVPHLTATQPLQNPATRYAVSSLPVVGSVTRRQLAAHRSAHLSSDESPPRPRAGPLGPSTDAWGRPARASAPSGGSSRLEADVVDPDVEILVGPQDEPDELVG